MAAVIEVENLTVSYGPKPALLDITVSIEEGTIVGVIGPNGSGKSTFLKSLLGLVPKDIGRVKIFGQKAEEVAGLTAYVPQRSAVDWDFPVTVFDVAMMGRYGHIPWWKDPCEKDKEIVDNALEMVRMTEFSDRQIGQLSGGQQQRVFMARALAQGGKVLLLDEPFAGVDAATEHAIFEVLERMRGSGRTLVVVHHDLTTAAEYFDKLLLLKQRLYAYGEPRLVLKEELLCEVYEGRLRAFTSVLGGGKQ